MPPGAWSCPPHWHGQEQSLPSCSRATGSCSSSTPRAPSGTRSECGWAPRLAPRGHGRGPRPARRRRRLTYLRLRDPRARPTSSSTRARARRSCGAARPRRAAADYWDGELTPAAGGGCSTRTSSSSRARAASARRRSPRRSGWPPPRRGPAHDRRRGRRARRRLARARRATPATFARGRARATACTTSRSTRRRRWRSTSRPAARRGRSPTLLSRRRALFGYLAAATPGMRELLTVGKVWELAQDARRTPGRRPVRPRVLDAPATGHGVASSSAPRTFADAARVGPIARQGRTIDAMLTDPARTGVVAVARAGGDAGQRDARAASARCAARLGLRRSTLAVVNALLPDRFTAAEARDARRAPRGGPAASQSRAPQHARARAQRSQLARLRRGLRDRRARRRRCRFASPGLGAGRSATALGRRLDAGAPWSARCERRRAARGQARRASAPARAASARRRRRPRWRWAWPPRARASPS